MDDKCKAALELLVQNGYLEAVKGKYRCTAKLNDAVQQMENGVKVQDWESLYVQFIQDCKIPSRGESSDGSVYDLNKYSIEGMKRFKQMIGTERIDYGLLVKVTSAYYKSPGRYKKKIGNYITEGIWRMDYMVLKDQNPEQQQQTLKQQLNDSSTFTRDRIG